MFPIKNVSKSTIKFNRDAVTLVIHGKVRQILHSTIESEATIPLNAITDEGLIMVEKIKHLEGYLDSDEFFSYL